MSWVGLVIPQLSQRMLQNPQKNFNLVCLRRDLWGEIPTGQEEGGYEVRPIRERSHHSIYVLESMCVERWSSISIIPDVKLPEVGFLTSMLRLLTVKHRHGRGRRRTARECGFRSQLPNESFVHLSKLPNFSNLQLPPLYYNEVSGFYLTGYWKSQMRFSK